MTEALAAKFSNPVLPTALNEYALDFWQRSILFLDILRQRGDAREEMLARGVSSVLLYDTELVMRGDTLPRPVNYSLLRVIPPASVEIDDRKRPVMVIDPRAGQGPGIGGFKAASEIGEAFKAGHPVYFVTFAPEPVEGQLLADVAAAEAQFIEEVQRRHPGSGKPAVGLDHRMRPRASTLCPGARRAPRASARRRRTSSRSRSG